MNILSARRLWLVASTALTIAVSAMTLNSASVYAGEGVSAPPVQPSSQCEVPRLLGLDRSFAEGELKDDTVDPCAGRLELGHVTVRHPHRRGALIVVSQTPRAGAAIEGPTRVRFTLARAPALPKSCRAPAFYEVFTDTPHLVLWKIIRGHYEEGEATETYYACTPPHGPKRVIAEPEIEGLESGSSIEGLTSAGAFVGFNKIYGSKNGGGETLTVDDVSTGHKFEIVVESYATEYGGGGNKQLPELERLGRPVGKVVHTFVLNASGDVAWLGETEHSPAQPGQFVLYLHDHHGTRKIASGPDITGLAFSGSSLTWQSAGVAQSTPA
jgi:hypothetical protein